ncbi:MAG: glucose-6-phosphate dehydrogenase [[Clostridium] innocuum]
MKQLTFTIFGGTGDLTFRKLLPALYNLQAQSKLEEDFSIVIIGRRDYDHAGYCEEAAGWIKQYARLPYRIDEFERFARRIHYVQMDLQGWKITKAECVYKNSIAQSCLLLRSLPALLCGDSKGLEQVEKACTGKVIIEKPFGEDLESARVLNEDLERFFTKERMFHIDHYLGKEMVRNMQAIRFMNPIFQDVWNAKYIEHVQISAMETVGVENRGGYYDQSGALKDMVQNHLFQILSITAMEQPSSFFGEDMHQKQLDVLHALRPVEQLDMKDSVVLGQYFHYQKEDRVADDSMTETYAALRLFVDNERWRDVPFYIRTGKKLKEREMEVVITFKKTNPDVAANVLLIRIQPTEGVYFQFNIKKPGDSDEIEVTSMDFCQSCSDANRINTPEGL